MSLTFIRFVQIFAVTDTSKSWGEPSASSSRVVCCIVYTNCIQKKKKKNKKIATTTTEMDLFDLVRAAPPPKNVREPTSAAALAKSEENDGKGDQKAGNTLKTNAPGAFGGSNN